MSPAAEAALRHVRREHGWKCATASEVHARPGGTHLVAVRGRDPVTGAEIEYGVRVGRRGDVLEDDVHLESREREERR